jgi:hypothetical protein
LFYLSAGKSLFLNINIRKINALPLGAEYKSIIMGKHLSNLSQRWKLIFIPMSIKEEFFELVS